MRLWCPGFCTQHFGLLPWSTQSSTLKVEMERDKSFELHKFMQCWLDVFLLGASGIRETTTDPQERACKTRSSLGKMKPMQ